MRIRITFNPVVNMADKELEADSWYTQDGWITFKRKRQEGGAMGVVEESVAVYGECYIVGFEVVH